MQKEGGIIRLCVGDAKLCHIHFKIVEIHLAYGKGSLKDKVIFHPLVNLCVRDLRIYADALDGNVYHYRDKAGLECDAVIHLRNGRYGLVEVKLGGDKLINEGAESLKKLAGRIDTGKMREPAFMMVLCGVAPFAYKREDGVYVVPVTCLKD